MGGDSGFYIKRERKLKSKQINRTHEKSEKKRVATDILIRFRANGTVLKRMA